MVKTKTIYNTSEEQVKAGVLRYFKDRETFEMERARELRPKGLNETKAQGIWRPVNATAENRETSQ